MLVTNDGIRMRDLLEQALFRWPILLGLGLLGALVGFFFSLMRPPLYQAEAVLAVNINYGVTEHLELVVEDRVLNRIAAIIEADDTLQQVLEQVPEAERSARGWTQPADLYSVVRLDQRLAEWSLVAIDQDPKVAAEVAGLWATVTLQVLDEAAEHAWKAVSLMGEEPFMVDCVQVSTPGRVGEVFIWECSTEPLTLDPDSLAGTLRTEIDRSRGMLPNISYELLRKPTVPENPVVWSRGRLVLAGAIAGLVVGFSLAVVRGRKEDIHIAPNGTGTNK